MVLIPAGEFIMGTDSKDSAPSYFANPQHKLNLPAFKIDKYEVTNAQYCQFLNAVAASADPCNLYDPNTANVYEDGGIVRTGTKGNYTYNVIPGYTNKPVALLHR